MKPPARAIVGHLIWSADGGVWALWRVSPFAHTHTSAGDKLAVHNRLRGLLASLPSDSMLLSVCEGVDPLAVVTRMAEGIDLTARHAWGDVCATTYDWLAGRALYQRRYYLAAALPLVRRPFWESLREASSDVSRAFGFAPRPVPPGELGLRRRQAQELQTRLSQHVPLSSVTAGEVCWLYARTLHRGVGDLPFTGVWEPPRTGGTPPTGAGPDLADTAGTETPRVHSVLAHLTDAVVLEGGDVDDEDRPRHRRYVRVDAPGGTSYQTVLAMADMPHFFQFPGGTGEWLFHVDNVDFPVDWCVRVRSVPNVDAQSTVRRKHKDLIGQVDEYDGDLTGAPPQLAEAIQAIEDQRSRLGANPSEPEMQATILLSIAAPGLTELEQRAAALTAMFEPHQYGLARPTGGQTALLRSMLPGTSAAMVCRDYTQFMLARDLAAGSPFCGPEVGDPQGLLLGVSLDAGGATPVLFDPAYGPKANTSPSLAAVGRLGSGKSFFLKRLCWDGIARGGQVVTIDRTRVGEYVRFAQGIPGRAQVIRLEAGADVRLDPLRTFTGDARTQVTLGFLSLLAGCSTQSDEGAALAEAVDTVALRRSARLGDVIDELERMGNDADRPDGAARSLARRLAHYQRSATGQLAFGDGPPVALEADFIVFWAPNLSLPDRETLHNEHASRMMLPEQVLGQALLYLVAAVGRQVVFRDPGRFAAALYDEAWALLASPHGQNLLIEGVRDGRKHNGAIWLASQHPNDFDIAELEDLLGSRFVFRQARHAIPSALRFLGVADSVDAGIILEQGLGNGQCLYRDVRDRIGLIQVLPPALPAVGDTFETAPDASGQGQLATQQADVPELEAPRQIGEPDPVALAGLEAEAHPELEAPGPIRQPEPHAEEPREVVLVAERPEHVRLRNVRPVAGAADPQGSDDDPDPVAAARAGARRRRRSTLLARALADGSSR